MKRSKTLGLAALCVLLGVLRWLDLSCFTDPATGFSIALPDWVRYLSLAAAVALLFWLGRQGSGKARFAPTPLCAVAAIVTGLLYLLTALMQYSGHLAQSTALPAATLLVPLSVLLGGWLMLLGFLWFPKQAALIPLPMSIVGTFYFFFQTFLNGLTDAVHLAHVGIVWRALGYMAALWFAVRLLRAISLPGEANPSGLWSAGLVVFLMGTCLQLPQAIHWVQVGYQGYTVLPSAVGIGLFGLLGLLCAFAVTPE